MNDRKPLAPRAVYVRKVVRNASVGVGIIAVSLFGGMAGYHHFEGLSWIDSFVNAAMILSGMGPVNPMQNWSGKLFAGCYALYSGLALISVAAIAFAPIFHRFLHRFHLETRKGE